MTSAPTLTTSRLRALSLLGLTAGAIYVAPLLTPLSEAKASGALNMMVRDPVTAKECSECHIAYDPGMMPQGAWVKVMNDLGNHFGEDASLPEDTRAHILKYLVDHALPGDGPTRITEQTWFKHAHGGGLSSLALLFRSGPPPSMSNCNACHG